MYLVAFLAALAFCLVSRSLTVLRADALHCGTVPGDGHDGIWNLFAEIGTDGQRCEILDWYHLMKNSGR